MDEYRTRSPGPKYDQNLEFRVKWNKGGLSPLLVEVVVQHNRVEDVDFLAPLTRARASYLCGVALARYMRLRVSVDCCAVFRSARLQENLLLFQWTCSLQPEVS